MSHIRIIPMAIMAAAALSLTACRSWVVAFDSPDTRLVKAEEKVSSLSYVAQITSDGKEYLCQADFRSDGSVRRAWSWEENGKSRSYTELMLRKKGCIVLDDGSDPAELAPDQVDSLLFFSNLFMAPKKALTIDRDSQIRQQADAAPGLNAFSVKFRNPEIKEGTLMLAEDTGLWDSLQYSNRDGSRIRVNFAEYQQVGDNFFPAKTVTEFNGSESTALISNVRINPELPDDLFELRTK